MVDTQSTGPNSPQMTSAQSSNRAFYYLITLATFIVGVVLGFFLSVFFPGKTPITNVTREPAPTEIVLPSDAVQIITCVDHQGTLYVKPKDIPAGPIYMVHDNKVIGIEFMLNREKLLAGEPFKYLSALGVKVNHVNVGLLPHRHSGNPTPHYHIDLYVVSKETEEGIMCGEHQMMGTPSAEPATKSGTSHFNP